MSLPRRPERTEPVPNEPFFSPEVYGVRGPHWNMAVDGGLAVDAEGSLQINGLDSEPPTSYLYGPNGWVGLGAGLEINAEGRITPKCDYPPYGCSTDVDTSCVQNFGSPTGGLDGYSPSLVYTGGSTVLSQAGNDYEDNVVGGSGGGGAFYAERDSSGAITYIEIYGGDGYQSGDVITIPSSLINDVVDIVIILSYANGMGITGAWYNCDSLTSFPLLDVSSGTIFAGTWQNCNSLTSFPLLDVSSGTIFAGTWQNCNSLTSFPLLNVSNGANFGYAWYNCNSLTSFPAGMFNSCSATDFTSAWQNCALNQTSVDNILVSLNTAGRSNGTVDLNGGTSAAPGATGLAAKASLQAKGWTVTTN